MRLALECVGVAVYLTAHLVLVVFYGLGSTLQGVVPVVYWAALSLGYLTMLALAIGRPASLSRVAPRGAFDLWLLAAVPAIALAVALVAIKWPFRFQSWDGHGLGASGGEVNAVLFPWVHGLLWVLALNRRSQ